MKEGKFLLGHPGEKITFITVFWILSFIWNLFVDYSYEPATDFTLILVGVMIYDFISNLFNGRKNW